MATARREGPDVETEEFNPFLSPPPPPLNPAIIAAPALPPRDNNGRNSAGFSSTGSNAETASAPFASSRGRHPSRTSNGDVGGNLVASQPAHQQQQVSTTYILVSRTWHALLYSNVAVTQTLSPVTPIFMTDGVKSSVCLYRAREKGVA